MQPRPRDPAATRQAILDAAEALFAAHGFSACSMSEVAGRAGVAKSLIHHHFGSKAELWDAVLERRFAAYGKRQAEILDDPALDLTGFEESMRVFFEFLERNPEFVRLHAWANAQDAAFFGPTRHDLIHRGVDRLREMQARGEIRPDVDPASVLVAFFNLIEHWFQARPSLEGRFGDALPQSSTFLADSVRVLIRGIRP